MQKSRIEQLKAFIDSDSKDYFSRYALALEYVKQQKVVEGIEMLETILNEDENYIAAYYQLGKLYEMVDKKEKAIEIYTKGITKTKGKDNRTYNELNSALNFLTEDDD